MKGAVEQIEVIWLIVNHQYFRLFALLRLHPSISYRLRQTSGSQGKVVFTLLMVSMLGRDAPQPVCVGIGYSSYHSTELSGQRWELLLWGGLGGLGNKEAPLALLVLQPSGVLQGLEGLVDGHQESTALGAFGNGDR